MGAGADDIEVGNHVITVMRAEPGALGEDRLQRKRRTQVRVELVAEIVRGEDAVSHQITAQTGNIVPLEVLENAVAVFRPLHRPIDICRAQVGHRRQHVMAGAVFRRQRGIGDAGRMQVEGEIIGQGLTLENLVDQLTVARPETHRVMLQVLMAALEAEMDNEQRHRETLAGEPFGLIATTLLMPEQLLVGVDHIGVGGDRIGIEAPTVTRDHRLRPPFGQLDARHLGVQLQLAAQVLEKPDHPLYQRTGTAARKPDTALALQRMNQRVDR